MYMLQLFDADDTIRPIDARLIREGVLRIGRDPAADWAIVDPDLALSRTHCELRADAAGLTLTALGANGVFDEATGQRLPDAAPTRLALPGSVRLGRFRMVASHAPHEGGAGPDNMTIALAPPLGHATEVPSDWADATPAALPVHGSLLDAFCEGAGLDCSQFAHDEPEEVMRRAGAVYRQMVLGVGDLMAERERARARFQLTRTTIGGFGNNPFKWAPTQRLAIDLLRGPSSGFLSGPAALQTSFGDIKRHLVASFAGLRGTLRCAIDSFAPETLAAAAERRSGTFLKGRAAQIVDEASERHAGLVRQLDENSSGALDDAFVAAYDAADRSFDASAR